MVSKITSSEGKVSLIQSCEQIKWTFKADGSAKSPSFVPEEEISRSTIVSYEDLSMTFVVDNEISTPVGAGPLSKLLREVRVQGSLK